MEAIIRLRRAGCYAESRLGQIAGSCFLVVLLCSLYLSGLRQEQVRETFSGTISEENIYSVTAQPGLAEHGMNGISMPSPGDYVVTFPTAGIRIPVKDMTAISAMKRNDILSFLKNTNTTNTHVPEVAPKMPDTEVVVPTVPSVSEPVSPGYEDPGTAAVTQIKVILHANGGTLSSSELILDNYELDVESIEKPLRLGREFTGWYMDAECTIPYAGLEEGIQSVDLYAGWREFPGFICDEEGYITGYSDSAAITVSGIIQLPTESCLGVREGAFEGLESKEYVDEVYIPKNIVYFAESELNRFPNLMFIYVEAGNPNYYSENGILYYADGTVAVVPPGILGWS